MRLAKALYQPPQVEWKPREKPTGTITTFAPDPEVFPIIQWDRSIIVQWLRETAYLNKGLFLYIKDERDASDEAFYFDGGVVSFVRHLDKAHTALHKPVYVERSFENDTVVEVAFEYNDTFAEKVYTFANNINTMDGGAHLTGFRTALTRTLNAYARKSGVYGSCFSAPGCCGGYLKGLRGGPAAPQLGAGLIGVPPVGWQFRA